MAAVLPFESRYLQIAGYKMHYLDEGPENAAPEADIPTIICIHGNPTWSLFYRAIVAGFKDTHRIIVPDHIGCGLSERVPHKHFVARDRANHVLELMDKLGVKKFSLIVHDWGGPIGSRVALERFSDFEKIVYLNTTLTNVDELPFFIKASAHSIVGRFLTRTTAQFLRFATDWGVAKKLPAQVRNAYMQPYPDAESRQAIWDFVADIPFKEDHPTYPELMSLAQDLTKFRDRPVKIIWGLRDPCFHTGMLRKVSQHFPHAEVVELPDASHLVLEDEPERVVQEVRSFLQPASCGEIRHGEGAQREETQSGDVSSEAPNYFLTEVLKHAKANPEQRAIVEPRDILGDLSAHELTYRDLAATIHRYRRGLRALGVKQSDRVLFLVPPSATLIALVYAVKALGATPVFIDPGVGFQKMLNAIRDADPQIVIGSLKANILRVVKPELFSKVRAFITASSLWPGARTLRVLNRCAAIAEPAAPCPAQAMVVYTSGATGTPKGVIFTNKMLEAQNTVFRDVFGLRAGGTDLPLLPIFAMFGVALGVTAVMPPINPAKPLALDPRLIARLIDAYSITSAFGSPTLWRKITDYCTRTATTFPTLKTVLMAGAPVPLEVLARVQALLPNGEAYTPYGATEALPVTFIGSRSIAKIVAQSAMVGGRGTYVGKSIDSVRVKVVASSDEKITAIHELAPLEIGEIIVSGANVSKEYLNRDDANLVGKIYENGTIWHRMGDVGYLDKEGAIYFCGRKAHMVKETAGLVYYSEPVELLVNEHPKVARSALVAISRSGVVTAGICVEPLKHFMPKTPEQTAALCKEVYLHMQQYDLIRDVANVYVHPAFPVDGRHNAKIYRDQLSVWASSQPQEGLVRASGDTSEHYNKAA